MRPSNLFLALTSLFTLVASRPYERSEKLEPWQVSRMNTFSPSGRPGSSRTAFARATITNPGSNPAGEESSFGPSSANCTAQWDWFTPDEPYGQVFECETEENATSTTVAKWTMEIVEAVNSTQPIPTEDFDVKFTLTQTLTEEGEEVSKTYLGTQHFELAVNMRGTCGGSGVCSWSLMEEKTPVLVQPTQLE
ncbi:hypothetical protein GGS26DRAFT_419417 [Hypomontagnella submonticulosa]|nr:hypothetical protein GGS26DRAFT_419417 [Hypomontagnella submonticulosa]